MRRRANYVSRAKYSELLYHYRKMRRKQKRVEFSKFIILSVMCTYFIGLFFGMWAVTKILHEYPEWAIQALIAMFGYIGAPIATSIGFYAWKAKNENVKKIERSSHAEQENVDGFATEIDNSYIL